MKRDGASPVVAAGAADSVASIVSSGAALASAVSVTAGTGAGASSPSLSDPEITNAPIRRIPTSTAKRTLDELWLFAAGLDVFEGEPQVHPELLKCSNIVLAPHIASATEKTRRAMVDLAVENLRAALDGKKPPSLINTEVFAV